MVRVKTFDEILTGMAVPWNGTIEEIREDLKDTLEFKASMGLVSDVPENLTDEYLDELIDAKIKYWLDQGIDTIEKSVQKFMSTSEKTA